MGAISVPFGQILVVVGLIVLTGHSIRGTDAHFLEHALVLPALIITRFVCREIIGLIESAKADMILCIMIVVEILDIQAGAIAQLDHLSIGGKGSVGLLVIRMMEIIAQIIGVSH